MTTPEQMRDVWEGRGEQEGADIFGVMQSDQPQGEWRHWSNTMQRLDALNLDTPTSFLLDAKLSEEERHWAEGLARFGVLEMDAPCNNRLGEIARLSGDVDAIQQRIDAYDGGHPILETAGGIMVVRSQDSRAAAQETIEAIESTIADIERSIRRDKQDRCFADYTAYKQMFDKPDPQRNLNGQKFTFAPHFIREAMTVCLASAQNTRRGYNQGLIGKLFTVGNREPSFEEQRSLQGARRSRRWGGGSSGGGDDHGDI